MINVQCTNCKNYMGLRFCKAFDDFQIPEEIRVGNNDHTEPVEGDNGITFEPITDK